MRRYNLADQPPLYMLTFPISLFERLPLTEFVPELNSGFVFRGLYRHYAFH